MWHVAAHLGGMCSFQKRDETPHFALQKRISTSLRGAGMKRHPPLPHTAASHRTTSYAPYQPFVGWNNMKSLFVGHTYVSARHASAPGHQLMLFAATALTSVYEKAILLSAIFLPANSAGLLELCAYSRFRQTAARWEHIMQVRIPSDFRCTTMPMAAQPSD